MRDIEKLRRSSEMNSRQEYSFEKLRVWQAARDLQSEAEQALRGSIEQLSSQLNALHRSQRPRIS